MKHIAIIKFAITSILLLLLTSIFFQFVSQPTQAQAKSKDKITIRFSLHYKFAIKPALEVDKEKLACKVNQNSLKTSVLTPDNALSFLPGQSITLSGQYTYDCEQSPKVKQSWYINDSKSAASTNSILGLNNLQVGNYKVVYLVEIGKLKSETQITISVANAVQDVVTKPNLAPTVTIENPIQNQFFNALYDNSENPYLVLSLRGYGTDPEDGALQGNSLKWYYARDGVIMGALGTGEIVQSSSVIPLNYDDCNNNYQIVLKGTDTQGASATKTVNISIDILECRFMQLLSLSKIINPPNLLR